jgi:DNA-directed RNA polymerase specialized sigma24 family protein
MLVLAALLALRQQVEALPDKERAAVFLHLGR